MIVFKVGKKYFVPREKFDEFEKECNGIGVGRKAVLAFLEEAEVYLEESFIHSYNNTTAPTPYLKFHKQISWTWPDSCFRLFQEVKNFTQEELEI